jgi:PhnB protein
MSIPSSSPSSDPRPWAAVTLDLEVDDVDLAVDRALAAGATLMRPPDHPASGVQAGKVRDPFGHVWLITRIIEA